MPKLWGRRLPRKFMFCVGLYTIGYGIYDQSWAAIMHNQRERVNFKERYGQDAWVVISGATNPLGREYAKQFAKYGFNLVLVDEDGEQLKEVANEN